MYIPNPITTTLYTCTPTRDPLAPFQRERLRDEYENVGVGITNMLTGLTHMALPAPPAPPGLSSPSMPPPPPPPPTPSTPTTHRNNIQPPTPAPTPLAKSGKRVEPMAAEPSPNKRQKKTNVPTRTSLVTLDRNRRARHPNPRLRM